MLSAKQLQWRCRRGVRELDVLLTRFLDEVYPRLDEQGQNTFQRLLEIQDPTIMDWLFGKLPADDEQLQEIIDQLRLISGLSK